MEEFGSRRIGRTNLKVTTFGLGTFPLARSQDVSWSTRRSIIETAWDAGVRYFDAAPIYGRGAAERAVGDTLRDKPRGDWVLSTKVGRLLRPRAIWNEERIEWGSPMPFEGVYDYSYDGVMRSFEDSLQRLGLAHIDILLVHDIGAFTHGPEHPNVMRTLKTSGYRALEELRRSGAISAIGIGVNEREVCIEALEFGDWDVFLLAGRYTLLEQAPLDDLLPLCMSRQVSIIVGGPLNSGILSGGVTWNYAPAPPDVLARVSALRAICERRGIPMIAAALQFPLAHPAVVSVIPGPTSASEVLDSLEMRAYPISDDFWAELRAEQLLHTAAPTP